MNVLITGGAGYIGIELAYILANNENIKKITIYDSLARGHSNVLSGSRKFPTNKVMFMESDILNQKDLRKCITDSDVIYHLAAQVPTSYGNIHAHNYEQVNNWGSAILADELSEISTKKNIIYLSSLSIFGNGLVKHLENFPLPKDFYSLSKYRGEKHFQRLKKLTNHNVSIVRSGLVYGHSKNLRIDNPINRMVFDAHFKKRVLIKGDVDNHFPYIYIKDLIYFLKDLLENYKKRESFLYPTSMMIHMGDIYKALNSIDNEIEFVNVDQGLYYQSLEFAEDINFVQKYDERKVLENIIEYKNNFVI